MSDSRLTYKPLTIEGRLRLEEILARRWGRKHGDQALRALRRWLGWRIPSEKEFLDSVAHLSRPARARRLREARAQLPAMSALPPITANDALLAHKIAFGLIPGTAIVLAEHRLLTPFHLLAIIQRGSPMAQRVCRVIGGYWLRSVEDLQRELDSQREAQAARLIQLRQDAEPGARSRAGAGGASATWVAF